MGAKDRVLVQKIGVCVCVCLQILSSTAFTDVGLGFIVQGQGACGGSCESDKCSKLWVFGRYARTFEVLVEGFVTPGSTSRRGRPVVRCGGLSAPRLALPLQLRCRVC